MKYSSPKQLGNSLTSILDGLGISGKLKRYEVIDRWPQIVGAQIAQVTRADHFEGDKLFVSVSRATWRNELMFLKKELIDRVNSTMNEKIIQDIIFR